MLITDRRRMPASMPSITLVMATPSTTAMTASCIHKVFGKPHREFSPAVIWVAPKPMEVASPNSVPNTARMSIAWPRGPYIRSPMMG